MRSDPDINRTCQTFSIGIGQAKKTYKLSLSPFLDGTGDTTKNVKS